MDLKSKAWTTKIGSGRDIVVSPIDGQVFTISNTGEYKSEGYTI